MAPYQDYHKALADGYRNLSSQHSPSPVPLHEHEYGREAWSHFDPLKPTSLLYKKTADGGYKLVGAMYTDRVDASEDELNDRIPLSIARWHQHVNFCKAPPDRRPLLRPRCEVRPARFDHHQGSLRGRRRRVSSAHIRLDGPRLPLRDRPEENLVHGR